jgi:hypothetical protein
MRVLILALLGLAPLTGCAEDGATPAAGDPKAVNTICPMCGKPVDAHIASVAAQTSDGKDVQIGTCSAECRKDCEKKPNDYADDAVTNRRHEFNGKNNPKDQGGR